jgi:hypothetical protein
MAGREDLEQGREKWRGKQPREKAVRDQLESAQDGWYVKYQLRCMRASTGAVYTLRLSGGVC